MKTNKTEVDEYNFYVKREKNRLSYTGWIKLRDVKTNETFNFTSVKKANEFVEDYEEPNNLIYLY